MKKQELIHTLLYFNSIKVRLKLDIRLLVLRLHRHFNSIKVRLKPPKEHDKQIQVHYFNSIKVRLKQQQFMQPQQYRIFQFHKGTIKT